VSLPAETVNGATRRVATVRNFMVLCMFSFGVGKVTGGLEARQRALTSQNALAELMKLAGISSLLWPGLLLVFPKSYGEQVHFVFFKGGCLFPKGFIITKVGEKRKK